MKTLANKICKGCMNYECDLKDTFEQTMKQKFNNVWEVLTVRKNCKDCVAFCFPDIVLEQFADFKFCYSCSLLLMASYILKERLLKANKVFAKYAIDKEFKEMKQRTEEFEDIFNGNCTTKEVHHQPTESTDVNSTTAADNQVPDNRYSLELNLSGCENVVIMDDLPEEHAEEHEDEDEEAAEEKMATEVTSNVTKEIATEPEASRVTVKPEPIQWDEDTMDLDDFVAKTYENVTRDTATVVQPAETEVASFQEPFPELTPPTPPPTAPPPPVAPPNYEEFIDFSELSSSYVLNDPRSKWCGKLAVKTPETINASCKPIIAAAPDGGVKTRPIKRKRPKPRRKKQCNYCSQTFRNQKQLLMHCENNHRVIVAPNTLFVANKGCNMFKCSDCEMKFVDYVALDYHQKIHYFNYIDWAKT